ncbi:MAG: efflux transporter outer membrane subunit [Campylobacterales bacterium]
MKRFQYCSLALLVAFGISGCASFSSLDERAKLRLIDSYKTEHSYHANQVAQWPSYEWWRGYGDEQLNTIMAHGLKNSPDIAIAIARVEQANAYTKMAKSASSPQLSANAAVSSEKMSYNYITPEAATPQDWNDYGRATLNLSWEIDFWGKNKAILASATSELEALKTQKEQAKIIVSSSIALTYAKLAALYTVRDTAFQSAKVRKQTLELFKQRFDRGLENEVGVASAKVKLENANGELLALDEQISITKNQIAKLVGEGPDFALTIERPNTATLNQHYAMPKDLALNLLGRRPDIVAAKYIVEARSSTIKQKQAAFYPNVNLSAFIGFQSMGLDNLTKDGSDIGGVGPAIYLPIFSGGRLTGDLNKAEASYDEAVANYNKTLTHALEEVASVGVSQKMLSAKINSAQRAVDAANTAYKIAKTRYERGISNYIEALTASDNLLASQKYLAELKSKSLILDIDMQRSLGGGYKETKNSERKANDGK